MALDRRFSLRNLVSSIEPQPRPSVLYDLADRLADRPVLLGERLGAADPSVPPTLILPVLKRLGVKSAFFIPPMNRDDLFSALQKVSVAEGNLYPILHESGILTIDPARAFDEGVLLSGGSYSRALLQIRQNEALVWKVIDKCGKVHNIDSDLRLYYESTWLRSLPESAIEMFPRLRYVVDSATRLGYVMDFTPSCSVAELVFQGCLDGKQLFEVLCNVYLALRARVYCHSPIRLHDINTESTYLSHIERRTMAILESDYAADGMLRALYRAPWVEVNGLRSPSQSALIKYLGSSQEWNPVLQPSSYHLCHGDLILEDILVDPRKTSEFRLVDPNPFSHSALFDVAKTMLSLWIGYEFIYYDLFSIAECTIEDDGGMRVTITLERPECQSIYEQAANSFIEFAKGNLTDYLSLDLSRFESQLRMAAALHALAIPMFHLLHHKQESRAFAFACLGLYHASRALDGFRV